MKYILDTNLISEIRKGPHKMNPSVRSWIETVDLNQCYLSVITTLELEQGVIAKEHIDAAQGKILRKWLNEYIYSSFAATILPVTVKIAKEAARLQVPDPAPYHDALIGATALVEDCVLVTRNTKDFKRFGVALINPWEEQRGLYET